MRNRQTTKNTQLYAAWSHTYHHLSAAAESLPVVIGSNHVKFEVRAPHVSVHDGCLNYSCEGLNNKAIFAVSSWADNQPVQHGAVIPCVLIPSLSDTIEHIHVKERNSHKLLITYNTELLNLCCRTHFHLWPLRGAPSSNFTAPTSLWLHLSWTLQHSTVVTMIYNGFLQERGTAAPWTAGCPRPGRVINTNETFPICLWDLLQ